MSNTLITWRELRPILSKTFGHAPTYERWMQILTNPANQIPYVIDTISRPGRPTRRYDPDAVIAAVTKALYTPVNHD